jgi:hypothetical protein
MNTTLMRGRWSVCWSIYIIVGVSLFDCIWLKIFFSSLIPEFACPIFLLLRGDRWLWSLLRRRKLFDWLPNYHGSLRLWKCHLSVLRVVFISFVLKIHVHLFLLFEEHWKNLIWEKRMLSRHGSLPLFKSALLFTLISLFAPKHHRLSFHGHPCFLHV